MWGLGTALTDVLDACRLLYHHSFDWGQLEEGHVLRERRNRALTSAPHTASLSEVFKLHSFDSQGFRGNVLGGLVGLDPLCCLSSSPLIFCNGIACK